MKEYNAKFNKLPDNIVIKDLWTNKETGGPRNMDTRDITVVKLECKDQKGRDITVKDGCIYVDNFLFQDFAKDNFVNIKPPKDY